MASTKYWTVMIQIEDSRFNLTMTNDVVNECFGKDLSQMDEEQSKLLILSHFVHRHLI